MALGSIIGGAIGSSFGYPQLGAALGGSLLGGGLFGDYGAGSAREAIEAAGKLAEDVRFRPVTVGTTSGIAALDPQAGQYGFALSPAYQNVIGSALGGAGGLFQQLANFDLAKRSKEYFGDVYETLKDPFAQQEERLRQGLFSTGRMGLRLAGEGVGAGEGMVQPDVFGLGKAQQQILADLAIQSREKSLGEAQQLGQLAQGMLTPALAISELERRMIEQGVDAETMRAGAQLGAGQLAMAPYGYLFKSAQARSQGEGDFLGGLFKSMGGFGGGRTSGLDGALDALGINGFDRPGSAYYGEL